MDQLDLDFWFEFGVALFAYGALLVLPFALLVTLGLIRWFRARVARSMRVTAGAAGPALRPPRPGGPPGELAIERIAAAQGAAAAEMRAMPLVTTARRGAWRFATVYALATTVYALLAAAGFTASIARPPEHVALSSALLLLYFALVFATPAILAPLVVLKRQPRFLLLGVVALLALLAAADRGTGTNMVWLWLLVAAVPSAAVLVLNARRLRAVGPLVFAATLLLFYGVLAGQAYGALYGIEVIGPLHFVRGEFAAMPILEAGERYLSWLAALPADAMMTEVALLLSEPLAVVRPENPQRLTTGVKLGVIAIGVILTAVGAAAAWLFMRWLAGRYRRRRASDQMLTLDVLLLIFAIPMLLPNLVPLEGLKATGVLAGMLGYKLVASWGLRRRSEVAVPRTLLLLRVFGNDRRTQRLLEDLGRRWRHLGPIRLIGATDAAYSTIEPFEFFEFLNGRLSRAFVKNRADLESRLAASDTFSDPDGLFRIEDFFCHDDTWRMTVSRLARDAAALLMDLRGFSPANRGCVFEIEELVAAVPLQRILLPVDASTDVASLEQTLDGAWRAVPEDSPNAGPGPHRLRILQASRRQSLTLASLLVLLCESAAPGAAASTLPASGEPRLAAAEPPRATPARP